MGLKAPQMVRLSIAEDMAFLDEAFKFTGHVAPAERFAEDWAIFAGKAYDLLNNYREVLHEKVVERLAELW